jgi:hypothetical protein
MSGQDADRSPVRRPEFLPRVLHRPVARSRRHLSPRPQQITICVAAVVGQDAIITVSDLLLSGEGRSLEPGQPKFQVVGRNNNWVVMYSGGDITHFGDLLDEIRPQLADSP